MTHPLLPKTHRRPQHDANLTNTTGGYPLHQTSQSPTTTEEKKLHLLWEEQTRNAPTEVKKIASANPCAISGARCVDDQCRETPHRPHDTRSSTLKVVEHSKSRSDLPLLRRTLHNQPRPPPSEATARHIVTRSRAAMPHERQLVTQATQRFHTQTMTIHQLIRGRHPNIKADHPL
jgi:hypothetical protein